MTWPGRVAADGVIGGEDGGAGPTTSRARHRGRKRSCRQPLIVDPPATVGPCVGGVTLDAGTRPCATSRPHQEFPVAKGDPGVRIRLVRVVRIPSPALSPQAYEPGTKAQPRLDRLAPIAATRQGTKRAESSTASSEITENDSGGGAERRQRQVRPGTALGQIGRPALPVLYRSGNVPIVEGARAQSVVRYGPAASDPRTEHGPTRSAATRRPWRRLNAEYRVARGRSAM